MFYHRSKKPPHDNAWIIARKIPTLTGKQQRLTHFSCHTTHKPNAFHLHITLAIQESYARLGIDGEALNPDQALPIPLSNGVPAQALHVNGLTPHVVQEHAFLMTCNPCAGVADLKLVCKDILRCISTHYITDYSDLQFTEVDTEGGKSTWRFLLIRYSVACAAHRRLRAVLLHQPDNFTSIGPPTDIAPFYEPPFNTPDSNTSMLAPMATRTTHQIADFVKSRWTPTTTSNKQLRWFTAPLDANPNTTDDIITYGECETNTIYLSIELQDNDTGLTTSVLQGMEFVPARALIVLGTISMQYAHATRFRDPNPPAIDRIS